MTYLSGFSFIKHGLTLGYAIKQSIQSIEPICDEIVINVGFDDKNLQKDDGTWEYLNDNFKGPKYKFLKSWWDPSLKKDGLILSQQTNIALKECKGKYCQYIQGDEAIHEDDLKSIEDAILKMEKNGNIDGLIFKYIHFYGNVDVYLYTRRIYRKEVRLIRNNKNIISWKDAQGFKTADLKKLNCIEIPATIYHYGWARKEQIMHTKVNSFNKLYHENPDEEKFAYQRMWGLHSFTKSHPKVMESWIAEHRNDVDVLGLPYKFQFKDVGLMISDFVEKYTNYRMGEYKNFKILKGNAYD